MKKHTLSLALFFLTTIFSFSNSNRYVNDFFEIAFKMQQTLTNLAEMVYPTENSNLINSFTKLEEKNQQLFNILSDFSKNQEINKEYLLTLQNSLTTLEGLTITENINNENTISIFNSISKDFNNKLLSIDHGLNTNINSKVIVNVETKNDTGYFVYAKYSYDLQKNIKRYQFNNPTNNSQREMAPGYYIFWIEKGDYKSEERFVEIIKRGDESNNTIYFEI